MQPNFSQDAAAVCARLLGSRVTGWEAPGGGRQSVRLYLQQGTVIATRRRRANRAALEIEVLRALHAHGAPVPRVLAAGDGWLIQDDLGPRRLSAVVQGAGAPTWLERAIDGLHAVHEAGRRACLADSVVPIGASNGWLQANVLAAPEKVGRILNLLPPPLDGQKLDLLLSPRTRAFIKWDARPGNAAARDDDTVAWFDWEHCGARCALDDLVWLLADEYVDLSPEAEDAILKRHLDRFVDDRSVAEKLAYVHTFGSFHLCVRLGLILAYKGTGLWWDPALCLKQDKVGVTKDAALRICERGVRWSARARETAPLAPWFGEIAYQLAST